MRLRSPWQPRLVKGELPPSDRLIAALSDDILTGKLEAGVRLPPHRDLAYRLEIGLGTVTKAFAVLERRGLVRSVHGRGTFVAALAARGGPVIDLSVNTPPAMLSEKLLAKSLVAISKRIDPQMFVRYPPAAGHAEHRRQMARWLSGLGMAAEPDRLLLCNGAQQALNIAFALGSRPGGIIFAEAETYPNAIQLARQAGYRLQPIAMDGEGAMPEALDRALHAARKEPGPKAFYVTPTMQNPTTATMGLKRRRDIVRVCRQHECWIVEDDVYALSAAPALQPLAMLAPERTFYANGLSKTLSPGLRIGALVTPPEFVERAEAAMRASALMVSPISCYLMEQWLTDGTAASVRRSISAEAARRQAMARAALGDAMVSTDRPGFHAWVPMPRKDAERLDEATAAAGIAITPPGATAVDPDSRDGGLRLCLGGPSLPDLSEALGKIAALLSHARREPARRVAAV